MIIGIDPGQSGGIAIVAAGGTLLDAIKMPTTDADIVDYLQESDCGTAYIESVHSMPGQGVASSFKFGKGFGVLIGALAALRIRYEFVTPQKWQKAMGCLSKGDKNITKAAAQRLFPHTKMTHAIADACLIAEYGRRAERPHVIEHIEGR